MLSKEVTCVIVAFVFCCITIAVNAGPVVDDSKGHIHNNLIQKAQQLNTEELLLKKLNMKCIARDINACLMLKLMTYINRVMHKSSIELGDIEIRQTSTSSSIDDDPTSRAFNVENASDDEQLGHIISEKIFTFLKTRSLKWKIDDSAELLLAGRSNQDGSLNMDLSLRPSSTYQGDARKKKDHMSGIMAAAIMKIGLLKALAFKALVLLVGKALLVSKLALVLAAVIGLKKLLHSEKHVTYEVVAHPHHEHHDSIGSGSSIHDASYGHGWGRNIDTAAAATNNNNAQNLAYRGYIPKN